MSQIVEIPAGAVNGVNANYTTAQPYVPGSLSVWLNGQEMLGAFSEVNPALGTFAMSAPYIPRAGVWGADSLAVDYSGPGSASGPVDAMEISCSVSSASEVCGSVRSPTLIYASIAI